MDLVSEFWWVSEDLVSESSGPLLLPPQTEAFCDLEYETPNYR